MSSLQDSARKTLEGGATYRIRDRIINTTWLAMICGSVGGVCYIAYSMAPVISLMFADQGKGAIGVTSANNAPTEPPALHAMAGNASLSGRERPQSERGRVVDGELLDEIRIMPEQKDQVVPAAIVGMQRSDEADAAEQAKKEQLREEQEKKAHIVYVSLRPLQLPFIPHQTPKSTARPNATAGVVAATTPPPHSVMSPLTQLRAVPVVADMPVVEPAPITPAVLAQRNPEVLLLPYPILQAPAVQYRMQAPLPIDAAGVLPLPPVATLQKITQKLSPVPDAMSPEPVTPVQSPSIMDEGNSLTPLFLPYPIPVVPSTEEAVTTPDTPPETSALPSIILPYPLLQDLDTGAEQKAVDTAQRTIGETLPNIPALPEIASELTKHIPLKSHTVTIQSAFLKPVINQAPQMIKIPAPSASQEAQAPERLPTTPLAAPSITPDITGAQSSNKVAGDTSLSDILDTLHGGALGDDAGAADVKQPTPTGRPSTGRPSTGRPSTGRPSTGRRSARVKVDTLEDALARLKAAKASSSGEKH